MEKNKKQFAWESSDKDLCLALPGGGLTALS